MNIDNAFIQQENRGKLRTEERLVRDELDSRGVSICYFSSKHIRRRSLDLTSRSLVVGDMDCMYGAMKQLNIPIPVANSYPLSLSEYLYRSVKLEKLKNVETSLYCSDSFSPIFIKPAKTQKKFTGFVLESEQDLYNLSGSSKHVDVWCSQIVRWLSEWRVYVVNHEVKHISWYEGDESVVPCRDAIEKAIDLLKDSGESPVSYAIDFGVIDSGVTALVEMNDGFAIGAYEVPRSIYTEMILTRWQELLSSIES